MVIRQITLSHTPLTKPSHGTKKVLVFLRKKCAFFLLATLISEIANQMAYMYLDLYAKYLGATNAQVGFLWATGTGFEMMSIVFMAKVLEKYQLKTILLWNVFCVFSDGTFCIDNTVVASLSFSDSTSHHTHLCIHWICIIH